VTREPEFDQEQYNLMAGLADYEAGLGHHGLPLEETMSPLADPDNPDGEYFYYPRVLRDWHDDAIEKERANWTGDNYSSARVFTAYRVDR
jgi:hypothetical protein